MPELPEVKVTCISLLDMVGLKISSVFLSGFSLRYPISTCLPSVLQNQVVEDIYNIGRYILIKFINGTLIIHLGMSGNLQLKKIPQIYNKHEHLSIFFSNNNYVYLSYYDVRRFGAIIWTNENPLQNKILKDIGIDPLSNDFTAEFLFEKVISKKCNIKQLLMNNNIITGIGNIYANEILFATKIHPQKHTSKISQKDCHILVNMTKKILNLAIKYGGTTIKDHTDAKGRRGMFQSKLQVYGRQNCSCFNCNNKLTLIKIGGRSTVFCPNCQKL